MVRNFTLSLLLFFTCIGVSAQIVTLEPSTASGDDEIKIIFDATQGDGGLVGATKVYMHGGVVIDAPDGTAWTNVVGNWGMDDGVGLMTKVSGEDNKWEITLNPQCQSILHRAGRYQYVPVVYGVPKRRWFCQRGWYPW